MVKTISLTVGWAPRRRTEAFGDSVTFLLAAVLAASVLGFALGLAGGMVNRGIVQTNSAIAAGVALAMMIVLDYRGTDRLLALRPHQVLQSAWSTYGARIGSFIWGAQLGVGFLTFISSWAYVATIVICFAMADPLAGAIAMGTFGMARGIQPLAELLTPRRMAQWTTSPRLASAMVWLARPLMGSLLLALAIVWM